MKLNIFSLRAKSKELRLQKEENNEFMSFASQQFKQLSKKNLRIPIKLYHL